MRDWNYSPGHPITLPIAADARLGPTDYLNDQIWQLNLGNSEPPAISLQTTFGLRARFCRIFPRFIFNGQVVADPKLFHQPIIIHRYFPNYIRISFKPFSHLNVELEYWVPSSHSIAARTKIINLSHSVCQIKLNWVELLVPTPDGNRMFTKELGLTTILAGETGDLVPLLFLPGGAEPGKSPYPSLNLSFTLPANSHQAAVWAHASLTDLNSSYDLAKEVVNKNWDTELGNITRINNQRLEILTGNQDWNNAIYLSQTMAEQLILISPEKGKSASFVHQRNPDQGYSLLKDGSDYSYLWNGQEPLESLYLLNFFLPSSPGIMKGILENFLAAQKTNGEIDLRPGLAEQRSQVLATPLLAYLAWRLYEYTRDTEYIKHAYPKLLAFFLTWFSPEHDRDRDTVPEWDQLIQTGDEEHPIFSYLNQQSGGLDISTIESPALCAYLYQEAQSLISIARESGNTESIDQLLLISQKLHEAVDESWNDNQACYLYRDRESHSAQPSEILGKMNGSGSLDIHRDFTQPIRLQIIIKSNREGTRPAQIFIHGTSISGAHRIDHVLPIQLHWQMNTGYYTSDSIYKTIEHIEVQGVMPDDEVIAQTPELTFLDQTLLIPLWAGMPSDDKAKILINLTIMNKKRFLSPFGIRSYLDLPVSADENNNSQTINFLWMSLILEGMLRFGERQKTAEIFTRSMEAIIHSLQNDMTFHNLYQSESGKPLGTANTITSFMPVGLFLDIAGVRIINPKKVEITGGNPFPWPVTIRYRGLTVVQQEKKTLVIFSDGQAVTVDNAEPQTVTIG